MNRSLQAVANFHMIWVHCWMDSAKSMVDAYASMLDPRPDLAVPARSTLAHYEWWWG